MQFEQTTDCFAISQSVFRLSGDGGGGEGREGGKGGRGGRGGGGKGGNQRVDEL